MAEENAGAGSGFMGMFNAYVDPQGLAKRVPAKMFWLWPLITVILIFIVFGYLMVPYTLQLVDAQMAQRNIPPESIERARNIGHMFGQASVFITPVFVVLILMLMAWLVTVTGSIVGIRTKFRDVFSIASACSLISCLQYAATYIVIRTKGDEITSQEQITPPFGLDIFIPAHGALLAILNFFSIFEIWYLVIFALTLAYLTNSSKGKAFFAITPAWLIPLIFRIIGSLFSGGASSNS
jgi:hypothetical protein